MSTLAYGLVTAKREAANPGTSRTSQPPALGTFIDVLAALVPAEVLAAHAAILSITTKSSRNAKGEAFTTITEPGTLKWVFVALAILSVVLYFFAHSRDKWDRWDFGRMLIPPLAFVGWTMIQKTTAFDAFAPGTRDAPRYSIAIIGAVVLAAAAVKLAGTADAK